MRARWIVPVSLGLVLLAAFSGAQPPTSPDLAGPVAIGAGDPEDRGRASPGAEVTRRVVLTNNSPAGVRVRLRNKTCVGVNVRPESVHLDAGASAEIELSTLAVEADAEQRHGAEFDVLEGVDVPKRVGSVWVWFRYTPDVEVVVNPPVVIMHSFAGDHAMRRVWLRRVDGRAPTLREVAPPGPWLRPARLEAAHEYASALRLEAATRTPGTYQGYLSLEVSGVSGARHLVDVRLRVDPALRATPGGIVVRAPEQPPSGKSTTPVNLARIPGATIEGPPSRVRVSPDVLGVEVSALRPASAADEWRFEVSLDHATLGARPCVLAWAEVLDARDEVLTRLPIVWFSADALAPHEPASEP